MTKETTKYYENIISLIENNVKLLEIELKEGGFFARFIIRRNLKRRKMQLKYYRELLNEYKKRKLAK
jgi:hypothetical protein